MVAADDDEICVRMGGDEFAVIGLDYDEKKVEILEKVLDELENLI